MEFVNATFHFRMSDDETENAQVIYGFEIAWEQICFILGVSGNVFVLYATIAHKAIKLDKMSIWIIKNLAVADIGNCVLVLLPILLTQYGKLNGMLLFGSGDIFYKVLGSYINSFFVANIVLINILSLNKLLRCIYPLRNLYTTRSQRIKVTALTISLSIVPAFWHINRFSKGFVTLNEVWRDLDYLGGRHIAQPKHITSDRNEIISDILYYLYIALPSLTLIIFNSAVVVFAIQKSNNAINKKNLLIVVIVTAGFFISFIPELVSSLSPSYPAEYREFSFSLLWLSCWTNPFIYLAVNPSFREFTKNRLFCRISTVQQVQHGRVVIPPTNTMLANVAVTRQVTAC